MAAILATTPQRRLIAPEEVAHAVLSLCDEEAVGINGEAIVIDGGALYVKATGDWRQRHRQRATSDRINTMKPYQIINPDSLGSPRGWNNGLLADAGWTGALRGRSDRARCVRTGSRSWLRRAIRPSAGNVLAVLREAGGQPEHIGRFTIYVTDLAEYRAGLKPLGEVYRTRWAGTTRRWRWSR